ncbi:Bacterial transcriptional activator domain protein [compost metagenome]
MFRIDPLEEETTKRLLGLYRQAGNKVALVRHYQEYEHSLREELGMRPEVHIRKLIQ